MLWTRSRRLLLIDGLRTPDGLQYWPLADHALISRDQTGRQELEVTSYSSLSGNVVG